MTKPSEEYPGLHEIEKCEVLLVTICEGNGTQDSPAHEVTYVCKADDSGEYEMIGELYDYDHRRPL